MNWVGKFFDLPKAFLNCEDGPGGGVIQGSASEAIFVAILTAREQTVRRIMAKNPDMSESEIRGKLIAYSSDQSNSCVEKAAILSAVPIKLLATDDNCSARGITLQKQLDKDLADGKIPIIFIATLGTTGTCSYDNLNEIGPICKKNDIWLHVDAAYAGAALCCPELRSYMPGIDWCDSINVNLHKWMMINFDCCAMWIKNADLIIDAFTVDRIYLSHKYEGQEHAPDYRHWQIPLGRRFRALKVWMVLRTLGTQTIQTNIRHHIELAKVFENCIMSDDRFEIVTKRSMGLVCFRLKGDCTLTKQLIDRITDRKLIYMIQANYQGKLMLRFAVCGLKPLKSDIEFAWKEIQSQADQIFNENVIVSSTLNIAVLGEMKNLAIDDGKKVDDEKFATDINVNDAPTEKSK